MKGCRASTVDVLFSAEFKGIQFAGEEYFPIAFTPLLYGFRTEDFYRTELLPDDFFTLFGKARKGCISGSVGVGFQENSFSVSVGIALNRCVNDEPDRLLNLKCVGLPGHRIFHAVLFCEEHKDVKCEG